MSSFIDSLRDEFEVLVEPVIAAVEDPAALRALLDALGADETFDGSSPLIAALQAAANLKTIADTVAQSPQPSFAGIAALLAATGEMLKTLRALAGTDATQFERFGDDLIEMLAGEYLRQHRPFLYQLAALATLVDPVDSTSMDAVVNGSVLVRQPFLCARVRFDRVSPLVNSPESTLGAYYFPNGLATLADANTAADLLFPRVGAILSRLGVPWTYGVPDDDLALLGDAAGFVDHTFQVYVPSSITGADADAGLSFTFSSDDHGGLGLVVSPFGALTFWTTLDAWTFAASLGAEIEALAIGKQGPTFIASAGTVSIEGTANATLSPPSDGTPAFVWGAPDGTRLELGGAKASVNIDASLSDSTVVVSAGVSSGAIVVAAGDGDSFLKAVLPAGGLRATFDLGISYSTKGGLAFTGGAGLEATLPVTLSLGGVVALQGIHLALTADSTGLTFETSAIASLSIGPVHAVVDRMGIATNVTAPQTGANLGVVDLDLGFKPPSGVGISIDAAGVAGGGYLAYDSAKHEYSGVLELAFESFTLSAFGLLATTLPSGPGYSLIALIDATFPPLQLGLGFTLDGVGGFFGLHRTASVDALQAALKAHTLGTFLFPKSPITNAPQVLSELDMVFPGADGRYLFGPVVQIGWGTPTIVTIDLALILELPDPVRLILIGELAVLLPAPNEKLLEIHVSALGVVDFGAGTAAFDATLHDSKLMSFALHGGMALRAAWKGDSTFVLAIGGVHPKFQPPPGFPTLDRVGISMASGKISKLELDGYVAVTSNTLQIGAHVALFVGIDGFGISGTLNFDTLIQRNPFHFDGDISGSVALTAGGDDVMSLQLSASLDGPAPWHAAGSVSFSILWWSVTKSFSETFGASAPAQTLPKTDVGALLRTALADPRSISATVPADVAQCVTLAAPLVTGTALAHPGASLELRQTVVPLGITIDTCGGAAPLGDSSFTITHLTVSGSNPATSPVLDAFAPAQFLTLSDDEKLASPSFEQLQAGVAMSCPESAGAAVARSVSFETFYIDTAGGVPREDTGVPAPLTVGILGAFRGAAAASRSQLAQTGSRRFAGATTQSLMPRDVTYAVAATDTLGASGVGAAAGQTYAQARAARNAAIAADGSRAPALALVATYEIAA